MRRRRSDAEDAALVRAYLTNSLADAEPHDVLAARRAWRRDAAAEMSWCRRHGVPFLNRGGRLTEHAAPPAIAPSPPTEEKTKDGA